MEAIINTKKDDVWFHEIISPVTELIQNNEYLPSQDSGKAIDFTYFIRLLLCFYLNGTDSLRSLITDLKSDANLKKAGFRFVGLSTIHDAFCRYSMKLLQKIYLQLLKTFPAYEIEEFKALGQFILTDGSLFPTAINNFWAEFKKKSKSVKMHLNFSLNQMRPTCFIITPGKADERKALKKMIQESVTYIADRGYMAFDFFKDILDQGAHFIIRVRKNLKYIVKEQLPVEMPESVKYIFFNITDELVHFGADKYHLKYRRISFRTRTTLFVIVTTRLDLTTYQIVCLYAFRWQIELFFRYFKRTLNAKHLINKSKNGVSIQFYSILIVNLLLMRLKQKLVQNFISKKIENDKKQSKRYGTTEEFVHSLGKQIPTCLKIKKQELNTIRNMLFQSIQIVFNFL